MRWHPQHFNIVLDGIRQENRRLHAIDMEQPNPTPTQIRRLNGDVLVFGHSQGQADTETEIKGDLVFGQVGSVIRFKC